MIRIFYDRSFHSKAFGENLKELKIRWFYCDVLPTEPAEKICFLSDEGTTLETLDFTIYIGSTPTFLLGLPVVAESRFRLRFWVFLCFIFFFHIAILQFPDRLCEPEACI